MLFQNVSLVFHWREAPANMLTHDIKLDPVAKIPENKVCAVRIENPRRNKWWLQINRVVTTMNKGRNEFFLGVQFVPLSIYCCHSDQIGRVASIENVTEGQVVASKGMLLSQLH